MSEQAFQTLYKRLNNAQKEAVDRVEGPVIVIAGPGTGKTEILTFRIANILKQTDTEPENILALTFTESGRVAMRRRLAEIIGSPAYGVGIMTFHGFCNDIIQTYPEEFPHIIGGEPITEVDQIRVIEEIVKKLPLEILKPIGDPLYYIRNIETALGTLKREGVSVEKFKHIADEEEKHFKKREDLYHEKGPARGKMKGEYIREEKEIQKHKELAEVYAEYQKTLRREKRYDYSDMIMETLEALQKNENLLRILQEKYQYVLVDEHQDTNNAQNKILELLLGFHTNPNIFVVGDEKQAIFRFQGASLQNFLYFKNLYSEAKGITLEENYRSQQTILDGADSILAGEKKLKAQTAYAPEKIKIRVCANTETEESFVRESIREKLRAGVLPGEIAVLYRENKDAFPFADALRKEGIPFRIESDENILEDKDVQKLILLLRTVEELGDETRLGEALHIDFIGIPPLDVYKLLKNAKESKRGLFEIMREADAETYESPKRLQKMYRALERWKRISKNHPLSYLLEKVMEESGYIESLVRKKEREEKIGKLRIFFK
ncbi:MAG: ATP-dependent helicase, partial [Candidatus Wolfebacteria bacterium]|nr:ATP-dependent helicase [Candidatus Wolfebacteria bacterium]